METLSLFDFDLTYAFINGLCSMVGFLGWQAWLFKKDEEAYSKDNKKGDYIFGLFIIPFVFTFGAPYFWDYLDKDTWYNPLTSFTGGLLFDFIMLYTINKAKKKSEEV